jgi:ankyrin repeat protein
LKTDNVALFKYSLKYVSTEALSKTVIGNRTLLQRACESGRHQFVKMLLGAGADPNFSKAKSSRPGK